MKKYKFIGIFISFDGNQYELDCYCDDFFQAFFILTAKAIGEGKHYQLASIEDEKGNYRFIDDITKCNDLIKYN